MGGFHFLDPVLWPTGPEASSPGKWHTFCCFFQSLHGARFEGKPTKKYAEQISRCQKSVQFGDRNSWDKKGMEFPVVFNTKLYSNQNETKKILPQKSKKIIANQMWLAIFVLASGFSSSTVGIWAHQSDLLQKVGHNYGQSWHLSGLQGWTISRWRASTTATRTWGWERSRRKEKPEINTIKVRQKSKFLVEGSFLTFWEKKSVFSAQLNGLQTKKNPFAPVSSRALASTEGTVGVGTPSTQIPHDSATAWPWLRSDLKTQRESRRIIDSKVSGYVRSVLRVLPNG